MKKFLFFLFLAGVSTFSFSQSCVYLGIAGSYSPTTNGSTTATTAPTEFGCYSGSSVKQFFWQSFYSPNGGNYVQGYSSSVSSSLDLDWIVFDMGTTAPSVTCPISTTGRTSVNCSTTGSGGTNGGPGYEGTVATTAGHYYLVCITFWQTGNTAFNIAAPTLGGIPLTSTNWVLTGNNATTTSNFIGTNDNISFRFRTNNTQKMILDSNGRLGIGIALPLYPLDVNGKARSKGVDFSGYLNSFQLTDSSLTPKKYVDSLTQAQSQGNWKLLGNAATTPFNFIGTTDNLSFRFRTNNTQKMILDSNGRLGIGIALPLYPLDVNGKGRLKGVDFSGYLNSFQLTDSSLTPKKYVDSLSQAQSQGNWRMVGNTGTTAFNFIGTTDNFSLRFRTNNTQKMILDSNGRLGIGIALPLYPLDVNGKGRFKGADFSGYLNSFQLTDSSLTPKKYVDSLWTAASPSGWKLAGNAGINPATAFIGTTDNQPLIFRTNNVEAFRVNGAGNIGIGTTSLSDTSYKLFVETGIRTRKIKVDMAVWSDYVFEKDYDLRSLTDLEKFIRQYHHLPDVPSTASVKSNGIDVGENQSLLLKKIEELTLYVIEQNKQLETQNKKMQLLQVQMNKLRKSQSKKK